MDSSAFTVAQIARALSVTPQAVRQRVAGLAASASRQVMGNAARWFRLDEIPPALVEDLVKAWKQAAAITGARPWRNLAHFISDPPPPATDGAKAARQAVKPRPWCDSDFERMDESRRLFVRQGHPTPGEAASLWQAAFETLEGGIQAGRPERSFKRAIVRWMMANAPGVRCSIRTFNRRLTAWRAGGRKAALLVDRRPSANAARKTVRVFPAADSNRLLALAIKGHGREVGPAWIELQSRPSDAGGFSPETRARFSGPIPRSLRSFTVSRAREYFDYEHQPRKAMLNSAYVNRDWSEVAAGDWFGSDDFTLEVYFYAKDGAGGWKITRGQFLPMVDERSLLVLDFILIPEKHYTGANIRTLINKVGLRYGLPRVGFHFERGIWKQSQLVAGAVPWGDAETSLAERLSIKFQHSLPGNAKAKPIEFIGRLFQRRLRRYRGWVGSNEQIYKIESVQQAKLAVESGRKTPWDAGFMSLDEWSTVLQQEAVSYNHTEQLSKIMGGNRRVKMSPEYAWAILQGPDSSLVNLRGSGAEYLLSKHMRSMSITRTGIRFRHEGVDYAYCSAETGSRFGKRVNVYFSPELPDMAHIETEDGEMLHVPAQPTIPAHGASMEDFRQVAATAGAHNSAARAFVSNLPHDFMPPHRVNLPNPEMARRQAAMAEAEKQRAEANRQDARRARRMGALGKKVGVSARVMQDGPNPERALEMLAGVGGEDED